MHAITGITGKVGGALARTLLAAGQPVRAVVRDGGKAGAWAEQGMRVCAGGDGGCGRSCGRSRTTQHTGYAREHFHRFGGRVGLFRTQPADRILDAADLVITIGYDPIEFEPGFWNRGKIRNLIHIDVLSADIDNDYRPQVELVGNIGATLRELIDHTNAGGPASGGKLLREVAIERGAFAEKATALNGTPIHPIRLVHELQTLLSDDMTLCLDMARSTFGWLGIFTVFVLGRF